ncbi:hypothetical protein TKK_0003989 [Trichogramma kaykai]
MDPTTPPTKPPRAAGHHPRGIAFRDVVTRDEAASLARRCLGEDARLVDATKRISFEIMQRIKENEHHRSKHLLKYADQSRHAVMKVRHRWINDVAE